MKLRSLRHQRPSGYAEHQTQLYTNKVTAARGEFITHLGNFCKNKLDDGWLSEREDPKKLKKSLTNIFTTVNRCYDKSEKQHSNHNKEG